MTLEQLPASVTVITELRSVITTVLGVPTSLVQNIQISLHNSNATRRLVQTSNLEISVTLYQNTQPIANQEILSLMQLAVEQATFSQMNVTEIVSSDASYQALCGNEICETHEATQGHALVCGQDCSSTQECPQSEANSTVGVPGTCAGRGSCILHTGSAECSCNFGHQGALLIPDTPLLLHVHIINY